MTNSTPSQRVARCINEIHHGAGMSDEERTGQFDQSLGDDEQRRRGVAQRQAREGARADRVRRGRGAIKDLLGSSGQVADEIALGEETCSDVRVDVGGYRAVPEMLDEICRGLGERSLATRRPR